MAFDLDDKIPFSKRHPDETIRQIIRYDSGYLKDLFLKDDRVFFSKTCFKEICRLTKGCCDNWEQPNSDTPDIFAQLKPYATPYPYDFNDEELKALNESRLNSINNIYF